MMTTFAVAVPMATVPVRLLLLLVQLVHHLLVHGGVADDAVVKGQALLLELIGDGEQRLELLLLLAPVLVQLQEDLDGERLHELEDNAHAAHVEKEEDQPAALDAGDLVDGFREVGNVLAEEHDDPDTKSRREVVEVQHVELLLLVLGLLQLLVADVQQPAPELHAEGREQERDGAKQRHNMLGGRDEADDGLNHQLDALEALELLDDTQETEQPQDVHVPLDVATRHALRELVEHGRREQHPGREEVELVGAQGPVLLEGYDAHLETHLAHVDQGEAELEVLHPNGLGPAVQVVHRLGDHQAQVHQEDHVHEPIETALVDPLAEPDEVGVVPDSRELLLHGRVQRRRPEVVLDHSADVEELALVDAAAPVLVHGPEDDLRLRIRDGADVGRLAQGLNELQERRLLHVGLPRGLRQHLEGLADALDLLLDLLLLGLLVVPGVCRDERVKDQVEQQDLHDDEEGEPQNSGGAERGVGGEQAAHELIGGASNEHRVHRGREGLEPLVDRLAVDLAVGVLEDDDGHPREEDKRADVERRDRQELPDDRHDAEREATHRRKEHQVACPGNERHAELGTENHEDDAVDRRQGAHGEAEGVHVLRVVLHVEGIEVLSLQLLLKHELAGHHEDQGELEHDTPEWRDVRQVRQEEVLGLHPRYGAPHRRVHPREEVGLVVAPSRRLPDSEHNHHEQCVAILLVRLRGLKMKFPRLHVSRIRLHELVRQRIFQLPCCLVQALRTRVGTQQMHLRHPGTQADQADRLPGMQGLR
mmetsp:Transcript_43688/g.129324  ORF Transcript_43688/g.129324 Transcript_43688/m.129324 type:complete len:764 (+) Transcript_43688:304-2595(+)